MLKGKTAVITGASRGIGAAIALKLASQGANIAILDIGQPDSANEVKKSAEEMGVKAEVYMCDVTNSVQCAETVKEIVAEFGGVDILVNNA